MKKVILILLLILLMFAAAIAVLAQRAPIKVTVVSRTWFRFLDTRNGRVVVEPLIPALLALEPMDGAGKPPDKTLAKCEVEDHTVDSGHFAVLNCGGTRWGVKGLLFTDNSKE